MIAQVLAVIIFLSMFILIITEIWERHIVTLGCAVLTMVLVFGIGMHSMQAAIDTLNVRSIFTAGFWYQAGTAAESSSGINWETILFIVGMMRRDGTGWLFPLALHADCQDGKISGDSDFSYLYGAVYDSCHVY